MALELGEHRTETFNGADFLVLSPGVSLHQPQVAAARRAGVPAMGEIELASRWLHGRIVAITGTKGKSTTTTLTGKMFTAGGRKAMVMGFAQRPESHRGERYATISATVARPNKTLRKPNKTRILLVQRLAHVGIERLVESEIFGAELVHSTGDRDKALLKFVVELFEICTDRHGFDRYPIEGHMEGGRNEGIWAI